MILLKNKNEEFINSQPKIEKKLSKLYYKSINELRLKGYEKALNKCLDLTVNCKNFNMPDVELNTNDVYSRLYNNYILKYKYLKGKIKKSKNASTYMSRSFIDANNSKNNNNVQKI